MSTIPFLLIPLLAYSVPLAAGLAIALLVFKKRSTGDLLISSGAPICLWLILVLTVQNKSLSNIVIEPLVLAGAILIWEVIRLAVDGRGFIRASTLASVNVVGALLLTLCILFLMPDLPE